MAANIDKPNILDTSTTQRCRVGPEMHDEGVHRGCSPSRKWPLEICPDRSDHGSLVLSLFESGDVFHHQEAKKGTLRGLQNCTL